jgi:hypothetical protein
MDEEKDFPEVIITPVAFQRVNDEVEIDREFMLTMFSNDLDLLEEKIRKNGNSIEDLPF